MASSLDLNPPPASKGATNRSVTAWTRSRAAAQTFLDLFDDIQASRGPGAPSDVQQDLLRAMLVFACAGLDAAIGHLMRDTAMEMLSRGTKLRDEVDQFAAENMGVGLPQARFTLSLIRDDLPSTDKKLVEQYMTTTTSGSLQSHEVLMRLCDVYEVMDHTLRDEILGLRDAFRARNLIVHEMDINFAGGNRSRTSRRRDRMVGHTESVLRVTAEIIRRVHAKLDGISQP